MSLLSRGWGAAKPVLVTGHRAGIGVESDVVELCLVDAGAARAQQQVTGGVEVLAADTPGIQASPRDSEILTEGFEVAHEPSVRIGSVRASRVAAPDRVRGRS